MRTLVADIYNQNSITLFLLPFVVFSVSSISGLYPWNPTTMNETPERQMDRQTDRRTDEQTPANHDNGGGAIADCREEPAREEDAYPVMDM